MGDPVTDIIEERVGRALERFRPAVIRHEWSQLDSRQQGRKLREIGIGIYKWAGITLLTLFALGITQLGWIFHFFPGQTLNQGATGPATWICLLVDGVEILGVLPALFIFAGNKLRSGSFFQEY